MTKQSQSRESSKTSVVYALQTHTAPRQVERLVATLIREDPTCLIYISHDRRGPLLPARIGQHPAVHVCEDEGGRGRFHNVERWLRMAKWLRDHSRVDYVVTMTGQDYPVRPLNDLHDALWSSGDGFMEHFPVMRAGHRWSLREGTTRYLYEWHDLRPLSHRAKQILRPLASVNFLQERVRVNVAYDSLRVGVRRRTPVPYEGELWGGSFFTNLSWRAVRRVLDVATHTDFMEWARGSLLIEEAFFQTILLNSPGFDFVNSSGRFYDFSNGRMGSPAFLQMHDIPRVLASGAFFARKWHPNAEAAVYDRLDAALSG